MTDQIVPKTDSEHVAKLAIAYDITRSVSAWVLNKGDKLTPEELAVRLAEITVKAYQELSKAV